MWITEWRKSVAHYAEPYASRAITRTSPTKSCCSGNNPGLSDNATQALWRTTTFRIPFVARVYRPARSVVWTYLDYEC